MKVFKIILSFGAIVALALVLTGCGAPEEEEKDSKPGFIETEKKKAEERGRIPKQTVDRARQKIADVEQKMKDRMNQVE